MKIQEEIKQIFSPHLTSLLPHQAKLTKRCEQFLLINSKYIGKRMSNSVEQLTFSVLPSRLKSHLILLFH